MKEMIYKSWGDLEILFEGKYKGYQFYILNLGTHPTAYIEIPSNHKLFRKSYDEIYSMGIDVDVHGGLTYSSNRLRGIKENSWFIGWDYAHAGDFVGYDMLYPSEYRNNDKNWTTEEIFEDVKRGIECLVLLEEH